MVVDLVVAVTPAVAASKAVGSMVADKLQVVALVPVEVASALAACAAQVALGTLRAQDLDFLRSGVLRTHSLSPVLPTHKFRVQLSQGSWISASPAFAITL